MTPPFASASSNVGATVFQQRFSRTWYSNSALNLARVDWGGAMAASPKGHTVLPEIESATFGRRSRSDICASPASIRSSRRSIQPVPSRQGEHLPQDSCL